MPLNSLGEYYELDHVSNITYFNTAKIGIRKFHRETGPARILYTHGSEYWYLNGYQYQTPEEMPLSLFLAYCKWEYNK